MTGDHIGRRIFVKAGGMALVSLGVDPIFLTRAAYAARARDASGTRKKTLVCIFQRGAVDGLNMIVPHGDRQYYQARPRIAVPPPGRDGGALDLDGMFGLHPVMAPLMPFYHAGTLAAIHAVGSPDATRSHFDAQDYMETGTPGRKATRDGWLNRHLAHAADHSDTPFRGVAIGAQMPRALRGGASALAIDNLQSFGMPGRGPMRNRITTAFEQMYGQSPRGLVANSAEEAFDAVRRLDTARPSRLTPGNGAEYPASPFGRAMEQIAQLIRSDLGVEIAFADVGGWDTHINQGSSQGQLANRLSDFANALAAFAIDLGELLADVTVLTMSEFGRTIAENGSVGTDHGHATAMLVLGGPTRGGRVYGRWPTLDPEHRFEGRDLAVTTDFRDFFAEVLVRHLGTTDLAAVFPGYHADPGRWPGILPG